MPNESNVISLALKTSVNARKYTVGSIVHKPEFDKAIRHITDGILAAESENDYQHNAITITGTRGSGKTSFLLSLKDYFEDKKTLDQTKLKTSSLEVLDLIDPTLIEEKGHIFLNVLSLITDVVDIRLDILDANPPKDRIINRKQWRDQVLRLANGIPSLDGVGHDVTDGWYDAEIVMENGMKAISSARQLRTNFKILIDNALKILGKNAFLLIFDDIDVDTSKGLAIIECIRKYFTFPQLIIVISGDLEIYTAIARQQKWKNLGAELLKYEGTERKQPDGSNPQLDYFNNMVTALTSQYLLKVLQPQYRIYLNTLLEKKKTIPGLKIETYFDETNKTDIELLYRKVFSWYGIANPVEETVYTTFMLGQPLRTQIQFLIAVEQMRTIGQSVRLSDFFLPDLVQREVNIHLAENNALFINATILKLLLKQKRLNDLYQLQPVSVDASLNASAFSLSLLFSSHTAQSGKFLIFDYFIRIGYLRNLLGVIPYSISGKEMSMPNMEELCDLCGVFNDNVLRDVAGHIQGYLYGALSMPGEPNAITHSFIRLQGLKDRAKQSVNDRLDNVFINSNVSADRRALGFIPAYVGTFNRKNGTRVIYSIYILIAAVGELIKLYEIVMDKNDDANMRQQIKSALNNFSQLRSYPISEFTNSNQVRGGRSSDDLSIDFVNEAELSVDDSLVDSLHSWLKSSNEKIHVPIHLLGKISTRFFYAMSNLEEGVSKFIPLGTLFHYQIIAFFNAIVIEDHRENGDRSVNLNINNTNFSDTIFINNITNLLKPETNNNVISDDNDKENDRIVEERALSLSKWLLACPLFIAYLKVDNDNLKKRLKSYCGSYFIESAVELSICSILDKVALFSAPTQQENNDLTEFLVFSGSPTLLKTPMELFNELMHVGYPKEWFQKGNAGEIRKRNKFIKRFIASVFGNDNYTSTKINNFREFAADNGLI